MPVRRGVQRLVLKVTWPHPEGTHEALALRTWAGDGAVRLVAALPSDGLLLLERLDPDQDLKAMWVDEACEVIGELLGRLQVPAPPQVARLGPYLAPHLERMARRPAVPRRVTQRTVGLARGCWPTTVRTGCCTPTSTSRTCCAAGTGPTSRSTPSRLAGHPGFDVFPVLHNRVDAGHRCGVPLVGAAPRRTRRGGGRHRRRRGPGLVVAPGRRRGELDQRPESTPKALSTCIALTKALDD